jgi:hypothetical protein
LFLFDAIGSSRNLDHLLTTDLVLVPWLPTTEEGTTMRPLTSTLTIIGAFSSSSVWPSSPHPVRRPGGFAPAAGLGELAAAMMAVPGYAYGMFARHPRRADA